MQTHIHISSIHNLIHMQLYQVPPLSHFLTLTCHYTYILTQLDATIIHVLNHLKHQSYA